jgi:hypothetical protein
MVDVPNRLTLLLLRLPQSSLAVAVLRRTVAL